MKYNIENIDHIKRLQSSIKVFLTYRNIFITGRYQAMEISKETFEKQIKKPGRLK